MSYLPHQSEQFDNEDCEHQDVEDFHCLECGEDLTEELMAQAYDDAKDAWKYGE